MGKFYDASAKWAYGMQEWRKANRAGNPLAAQTADKEIRDAFDKLLVEPLVDNMDKVALWFLKELENKDAMVRRLQEEMSEKGDTIDA